VEVSNIPLGWGLMKTTIIVSEFADERSLSAAGAFDLEVEYDDARRSWDRVRANPSCKPVSDCRRREEFDSTTRVRRHLPRLVS
jgi:hypothetical protein